MNKLRLRRKLGTVDAIRRDNNESTPMKNALKYTMLVLAVTFPVAAFAALVGILPLATFFFSETAIYGFAIVGLMAIGLGDGGSRRPIVVHATVAPMCPPKPAGPARRNHAYGIRRRECVAA
jgi:hypothetical protein